MQVEGVGSHARETNQASFCMPPEAFDIIDVVSAFGKFVFTVVDTKVLGRFNFKVHQLS